MEGRIFPIKYTSNFSKNPRKEIAMQQSHLLSPQGRSWIEKIKSTMDVDFLVNNTDAAHIMTTLCALEDGCENPEAVFLSIFDHIHRVASIAIDEEAILSAESLEEIQEKARGILRIKALEKEIKEVFRTKHYLDYFRLKG